jgi:hypothetical protein
MFEWFKQHGIGRKIEAAVEDIVNGDAWGPFEGLERGEALIRVTLAKGEAIRFEKYVPAIAIGTSYSTTIQLAASDNELVAESPVKSRRKRY